MNTGLIVAIVVSLLATWLLLILLLWLIRPKGVPARELLRLVPDVVRLIRALITDRGVPNDVRLVIGGLFIWIVSPIDLIPEFIPVLGPLDDVIIAVLALRYVRRRLGIDDLRGRWRGSTDGFALLEKVIGSGSANPA